jgi:hypothetical protein
MKKQHCATKDKMTGHKHNMTIVTVGPQLLMLSLNYRKILQLYTIVTLTFYALAGKGAT